MLSPVDMLRSRLLPAVLRAVDPAAAVERAWGLLRSDADRPVDLIAFGKAAAAMTLRSIDLLGARLRRGIVIARPEDCSRIQDQRLEVQAADHPIPTPRNVVAAEALIRFAGDVVQPGNVVLALISGGGSAQISCPRAGLMPIQVADLTRALLRSGASIEELNCVRKHCELVKGGQLARTLIDRGVEHVEALVLSDVLGDRLDVISSGPFAADPTSFADAVDVLDRRGIDAPAVRDMLVRHRELGWAETPKPGHPAFACVHHHIIASNATAVEAACKALQAEGIEVIDRQTLVEGEAAHVGERLGTRACQLKSREAIVWGGETTVTVGSASGVGGRNQELALAAAIAIAGQQSLAVLSLGTDGIDGPTDAAGALVDGQSTHRMFKAGFDPANELQQHNSSPVLRASGDLILIGPTGTNVNDVMVALRL